MNASDKSNRREAGRVWPWAVLAALCILTAAPAGIAKALSFDREFNDYPAIFIFGFGILFLALWISSRTIAARRYRSIFLMTTLLLFLLNLGGCVAVWNELAGIN
jgi:hypothetical protein